MTSSRPVADTQIYEVLNLVTPCLIKHDADGSVLRRKFRITAADACIRDGFKFTGETYSGAVERSSVRYIANVTLGRLGVMTRNLDVKGAYFEGRN